MPILSIVNKMVAHMHPTIAAHVNHRNGYGRVSPYSKKDSWRGGMVHVSIIASFRDTRIQNKLESKQTEDVSALN